MTRQELEKKLMEIYEIGIAIGTFKNAHYGDILDYRQTQDLKNKVTILIQDTCEEVFRNG